MTAPDGAPGAGTAWGPRGCAIAGSKPDTWCGEPIHGAVMVRTYELPLVLMLDEPRPGAVLVCRPHWDGLTGALSLVDPARLAALEALERRAREARRGNAELTEDEEVGWLACARHIAAEPRRTSLAALDALPAPTPGATP